ncbi:hypothetical protein UY3_18850 [Chelonia mydas]|uniref:Uncharacterized protein n=1 Tax=Chelonia mydas TaxID=8469 RepID=M7AWQ8_CHEMY|nr:hypothetical protein UY3_18850 [Chelonia mydas]
MLLSALNPSFRGSSGRPAYFHSSRPPVDKELQKLLSEATKMTGRKADKIPIVPRFLQPFIIPTASRSRPSESHGSEDSVAALVTDDKNGGRSEKRDE